MKSNLKNLLAELVKETALARENLAATHLRSDKVRTLIFQAAREGQGALRIRLPDGVDVGGTDNQVTFMTWAKDNGLRVDWERRQCDMPDGRRVNIVEPVISWAPLKV